MQKQWRVVVVALSTLTKMIGFFIVVCYCSARILDSHYKVIDIMRGSGSLVVKEADLVQIWLCAVMCSFMSTQLCSFDKL